MIGSSDFLVPFPNTDSPGRSLSLASAWKSFAAPITPMVAEKKVTAHSPANMIGLDKLMADRIFEFAKKDSCVVEAAMETRTTKYTAKVENMAQSVPLGMALLGFLKSPDMDAPAKMPDVALLTC